MGVGLGEDHRVIGPGIGVSFVWSLPSLAAVSQETES